MLYATIRGRRVLRIDCAALVAIEVVEHLFALFDLLGSQHGHLVAKQGILQVQKLEFTWAEGCTKFPTPVAVPLAE
jgi:hypothetical protein